MPRAVLPADAPKGSDGFETHGAMQPDARVVGKRHDRDGGAEAALGQPGEQRFIERPTTPGTPSATQPSATSLALEISIDYRRLSMKMLSRDVASLYAEWFRALADPTRVQLLAWLAQQPEAVSVGRLTTVLPVGQSTVSHHLAALAEVGFVQLRRRGTVSLYAVNPRCLDCFPSAADVVMGKHPPDPLSSAHVPQPSGSRS